MVTKSEVRPDLKSSVNTLALQAQNIRVNAERFAVNVHAFSESFVSPLLAMGSFSFHQVNISKAIIENSFWKLLSHYILNNIKFTKNNFKKNDVI